MEKIPTHLSSRTAAMLMAVAATMPLASQQVLAADDLITQEIARRAASVQEADKELAEGRTAYSEGNYEEAVNHYRNAVGLLPTGPTVADRRHAYLGHMIDGSIALSQDYRRKGRYEDARNLLNSVLEKDPNNIRVKQELGYLDDPIRTNPVLTYKHTQNVDQVRKLLYRAEGYYNLGQYDEADEEYKEVLRIDKYNVAARRGMERVAKIKSDYFQASREYTRSELLKQVDQAWDLAVPEKIEYTDAGNPSESPQLTGSSYLRRKLQTINMPVVDFQDVTVYDAITQLRQRARELDRGELDPNKKGINFVVQMPSVAGGAEDEGAEGFGGGAKPGALRIDSLQLRNVPLDVVLKSICEKTGLRYKVEEYAVVLLPASDVSVSELYNKNFIVPPDFLAIIDGGGSEGGGASDDPFNDEEGGKKSLNTQKPVKELLEQIGIAFPEGATANFSRSRSLLTVRNTANNLDAVEQYIETIKKEKPRQIKMSTKFVEISQENSEELGFDWIISPFGVTANTMFLGGGTQGNQTGRFPDNYNSPVNGANIPGIPGFPSSPVFNTATGGLRSGDTAITRDGISAFLNNPNRTAQQNSVAPGILSLTGLFSDGRMQMIMRGLSQKKGADVMNAPSIVARSGERATIEIIREFIYPTEYEPPELPNNVGGGGGFIQPGDGNGGGGGFQGGGAFPVTPATPTAFETRNTGVILEVEPTLGDDGYTIDLRFAPEIVEFEGFVNYGSPIQSTAADEDGNPVTITITENRIEMPVFSTRRVNTGLTIYDGHTVAVGGLIREDVQTVEDKVPILGDLPVIGRLFQSKSDNHIKSNLIIFVTADIIDATGQKMRQSSDNVDISDEAPGDLLPPL